MEFVHPICGFLDGGIALNFDVISRFSECELLRKRKILFKIGWTDTFEIGEKWVRIRYPFRNEVLLGQQYVSGTNPDIRKASI